ncbi:zinc metalloprotease HtpX [Caldivirga sp. UBA161]|uniref:zinc metalloprotease HtpX n=1 Tax=Caldivirga sp. UBA161 TaxID=1915569 RepID=UPI0025BCBEA1|nr:zinc metalloprotease HtpX [Caldivirga sp. UBA161]
MDWELVKLRLSMAGVAVVIIGLGLAIALGVLALVTGSVAATAYTITGILVFIMFINIIQWLFGPYIINAMYHAKEVSPDDPKYGWLVDLVNEVAEANGIKTPKVYIAEAPFPNAFAYSSPIAGKRVAITAPLLKILNKDEIKAVLGHELGHLRHRDVEFLMFIGLIPALIYWLGYSLWFSGIWGSWWGGGRDSDSPFIIMLIGLGLLAVSFVFNLFLLALNRMREAYADVNSAITIPGAARNLQRALAKIYLSVDPRVTKVIKRNAGSNLSHMLFFSPLPKDWKEVPESDVDELIEYWRNYKPSVLEELFSDHPHPAKRIKLLDKYAAEGY